MNDILTQVTDAIAAIAALGTAAYGLVDTTKILPFWNVSTRGRAALRSALSPFSDALKRVLGDGWLDVLMGHWINGVPKDDQKAIAKSLIRLGLTKDNAAAIATASHVDGTALAMAVDNLEKGNALVTADINVLGRMDATVDALLDAAYERADQQYRNTARFVAGVFAILLSVAGTAILNKSGQHAPFGLAVFVGIIAIPLAPIAKDLSSALQNAVSAMSAVSGKKP